MIAWILLALWPVFSLYAFRRLGSRRGAFVVLFGGWAFLPVSPPLSSDVESMVGIALPTFAFVTKASVIGLSLLLAIATFERVALRSLRFRLLDGAMAAFCLVPLASGLVAGAPVLEAAARALYQTLAWGGPWVAGRVALRAEEDRLAWARDLAVLATAYALLVLPEFFAKPFLYDALYGRHTYEGVGIGRYFGWRPLGFLEDGNQLGIRFACAALAATGAAFAAGPRRAAAGGMALALAAATFLYQSVGAILLYGLGLLVMGLVRSRAGRIALVLLALAPVGWVALRASGLMDVRELSETTWLGRTAKAKLKEIGRGSLGWRLKQEEIHLGTALERPLAGHGRVRWWRDDIPSRPWGLWMIALGAYGVAALALLLAVLLGPALAAVRAGPPGPATAAWLAFLLVATADSLLNSTFLLPAVAAAGALAGAGRREAPRV